jgi:hypothetical protein
VTGELVTGDTNNISAELPAPRDDEPESLRSDIVDELTDHLQCAFNRELHSQASGGREAADSDPTTAARNRALARFGNPATIARRLWYDAMKERIMNQQVTMAAAIVMACTCLAMFALMWRSIGTQQDFMATQQQHIDALTLQMQQDSDEGARQREQLQTLLAESQQLNRELAANGAQAGATAGTLAETRSAMESLNERLNVMESSAGTSDWNPVEFRLVQGAEDGPPAAGFAVRMSITTRETGIPSATAESDETGIVRFERVRYGVYNVLITAPWKEYCYHRISLQPGESYTTTIVCPAAGPEPLEAQFAVEWPADLADRSVFMRINPWATYRVIGHEAWSTSDDAVDRSRAFGRSFLGRDGSGRSVFVAPSGVIHYEQRGGFGGGSQYDRLFVPAADGQSPVRAMHWPGADYAAPEVEFYVALSHEDQTGDANTMLLPLDKATIDRGALQWRVESGSPDRFVITPSADAVSAIREFYEGQRPSVSPRQGPTLLPAALMTTDLASAEAAIQ